MTDALHRHAGKIIVPGFAPERAVDYNDVEHVEDTSAQRSQVEAWIAKAVGMRLGRVYPSRNWSVTVNLGMAGAGSGVVTIVAPDLSVDKGYVLHIRNETVTALAARAVTAAGEILERYGVSRDRVFNEDTLETLPRDPLTDDVVSADAGVAARSA